MSDEGSAPLAARASWTAALMEEWPAWFKWKVFDTLFSLMLFLALRAAGRAAGRKFLRRWFERLGWV